MTSLFGSINVETPHYTILNSFDQFEIRRYGPCILATTTTSSYSESGAFQRLANFIFRNNQKQIAMTAPVISTDSTMSFVLPSKYKMKDLPVPDSQVKLQEKEEMTVAVRQFSWYTTPSAVSEQRQILENALKKEGITFEKHYSLFQYNPPWCLPFLRTNEIAMEVKNVNGHSG
jgi:hypothetical protein